MHLTTQICKDEIAQEIIYYMIEQIKNTSLPIDETMWTKTGHTLVENLFIENESRKGILIISSGVFDTLQYLSEISTNYNSRINTNELIMLIQNIPIIEQNLIKCIRPYVLDIGTHIIRSANYVNIQCASFIASDGQHTINGWQFIFGWDVYTVADYYAEGNLGFYELKLKTINGYNAEDLAGWAAVVGQPVDEHIHNKLRQWVNNLVLHSR